VVRRRLEISATVIDRRYNHLVKVDIVTLFPEICRAPLSESMMKRAQECGALELQIHDLRKWTTDKHRTADDAPFGGGPGMVMKPDPIFAAVEELHTEGSKVILMSPSGTRFSQKSARDLARETHLIILCGHYEGVDQRVIDHLLSVCLKVFSATINRPRAIVFPRISSKDRSTPDRRNFATGKCPIFFSPETTRRSRPGENPKRSRKLKAIARIC
jgi:hypothetical protein